MHYLYLLLFFPFFTIAQTNCKYEIEEKTDSTSLKILPEKIIHEKVFGNSKEILQFSLLQSNGMPILRMQFIEKSSLFLSAKCIDINSKIVFQLNNGKFVTLKSISENSCSLLGYDENEKSNFRILEGYFVFTTTNYDELKSSPISVMRLQYVGDKLDYNIKTELKSEISNETFFPAKYFIDFLKCVE